MLPYKSLLKIDHSLNQSVYLQIVNGFIREIHNGILKPGQQLPGSRQLASMLNLNRKTIIAVYEELMAQGWIEILPYKGCFISNQLPQLVSKSLGEEDTPYTNAPPANAGFGFKGNPDLPSAAYEPNLLLEVDEGSPDERMAPINELYKRCRSIANSKIGIQLLKYHDAMGEHHLRETLAGYLATSRGLRCSKENILITRGSQMAIFLIFKTLLNAGDLVAVGETNYQSANIVINMIQAKMVKIPVDNQGIDIDKLERVCQQKKLKAIYITPHHHFPTTVTLSAERRLALLALARKYRFMILEDDYDFDFHYSSSPILPLASYDPENLVVYVGGFSKLLAPAIRIGYMVGPADFLEEVAKLRKMIDRQGDPIMEKALAEMINEGEISRHLKKSVRTYLHRRDVFCLRMKEQLKEYVDFSIPEGGMVVWTVFKSWINLNELAKAVEKRGIKIGTQREFVSAHNAIRFGFASLNDKEIDHTIAMLAECLQEMRLKKP